MFLSIPLYFFKIIGDNMKLNLKVFGILMALLAVGCVVSAACAVDLGNDFSTGDFTVKTPSGAEFTENVNVAMDDINFTIFKNLGMNSDDFNSVIFFKDSTADKKDFDTFLKDLKKEGTQVEKTDKYVVLKNNHNGADFNVNSDLDGIFNIADDIFSSDGLNISADGNSVSLSGKGLNVSSEDGENISAGPEGISVSGGSSSDNMSVNVSSDIDSNIKDCDYSVYLVNSDKNSVIVISGNNLELLKSMAETVSFNGN